MHNVLLESHMILLPQVSLIGHLVFMFFLPPPHHSHLPFALNCSHFISPLFYTYTHLPPCFLHPPFGPNPNPASLSSFPLFCSFYSYPFVTITIPYYLISNYIVSHPLDSPSHPPASACPPLTPHFLFFIILWTRSIIMV